MGWIHNGQVCLNSTRRGRAPRCHLVVREHGAHVGDRILKDRAVVNSLKFEQLSVN
jgi:hypothetical protein